MHTISGTKAQPFGTKDDESMFHAELKIWREAVINGSEIKSTAFTKVYKITFFTRWFRVYKHYQMESTHKRFWPAAQQALGFLETKENDTSEKAWKAREKVRDMRTMLYRIEEVVSNGELEDVYLESKATLLDRDSDGGVKDMMVRVWGADKVKLYDAKERETQKVEKAQWNKELLEARKNALNKALSAANTRKAEKLAKEGKVITKIRSLLTSLVKAEREKVGGEKGAAKTKAPFVILNIPEEGQHEERQSEEGQQEFAAKNEEMIKRLKLEIDLEISTQQGYLLDDHQSPVTAEQYSASPPCPIHVHVVAYHENLSHASLALAAQSICA